VRLGKGELKKERGRRGGSYREKQPAAMVRKKKGLKKAIVQRNFKESGGGGEDSLGEESKNIAGRAINRKRDGDLSPESGWVKSRKLSRSLGYEKIALGGVSLIGSSSKNDRTHPCPCEQEDRVHLVALPEGTREAKCTGNSSWGKKRRN